MLYNNSIESLSYLLLLCPSVTYVWCRDNIDFHITTDDDIGSVVDRWLNLSTCSTTTLNMGLLLCGGVEKIDVRRFLKESHSLLNQQGEFGTAMHG